MDKKILLVLSVLLVLVIAFFVVTSFLSIRPSKEPEIIPSENQDNVEEVTGFSLPEGFKVSIFAENLGSSNYASPGPNNGPRILKYDDNGNLFVSLTRQGKVVVLKDTDNDFKADEVIEFLSNLDNPHGIAFYQDWVYIAEESRLIRVKDLDGDLMADASSLEVLVDGLKFGGHFTRTIEIKGDKLYLSVGSTCNVCVGSDERSAAILECTLTGECTVFARGTRNAVGLEFSEDGKLYATENSRDLLGDNLPADEVNVIESGGHYGWPFCYENKVRDQTFEGEFDCETSIAPSVLIDAHSAPLGLMFYDGAQFPAEYNGSLFVALHGSWNSSVPKGYKIVRIVLNNKLVIEDFLTGFIRDGTVYGRPVDFEIAPDGSLLFSDDNQGKIYRIFYDN